MKPTGTDCVSVGFVTQMGIHIGNIRQESTSFLLLYCVRKHADYFSGGSFYHTVAQIQ